MQRPENWPSPSEVEAVKRMGGGCRLVAECYEWLSRYFDAMTFGIVLCDRCGDDAEGPHSRTEAEVQSEA